MDASSQWLEYADRLMGPGRLLQGSWGAWFHVQSLAAADGPEHGAVSDSGEVAAVGPSRTLEAECQFELFDLFGVGFAQKGMTWTKLGILARPSPGVSYCCQIWCLIFWARPRLVTKAGSGVQNFEATRSQHPTTWGKDDAEPGVIDVLLS